MSDSQGYYSIVQYLPFPDRLEFLNIGVVLFAPGAIGVRVKIQPDFTRVNKLFGKQDRRKVMAMYESLSRRVQTDFSSGWSQSSLSRFAAMRVGNVQLSQPLPVLVVGAPEDILATLFDEMVVQSHKQIRATRVVSVVKRKFADAGVLDLIEEKPPVIDLPQGISIKVPFAYQNGAYNLIDPIRLEGSMEEAFKNASARAIEGKWLAAHSDVQGSAKRLIVVGDMSEQPSEFSEAIRGVMSEHKVKFYNLDDLWPLFDDIRSHARIAAASH